MDAITDTSLRRSVAVILTALAVVAGGAWIAVKATTDHLLYESATTSAHNWADVLSRSVPDLEQIANGELPSSASMAFFDWARSTRSVFRYVIYNTLGYSQLASEDKVAPVDLSEFSPQAVQAAKTGEAVVETHDSTVPGRPSFYAQAFVPVQVEGRTVAVIAAFVDETASRQLFYRTLLVAGAALALLTAIAFGLPAIAWYRRTKEKQVADRRIRYLAQHDALTGLANRARLIERLDALLAARLAGGRGLALHFIDLDRFKEVNDTLGHDGGDMLLRTVAERLVASVRTEDIVARLGGDEFVIVQDGVTSAEEAEALAGRLLIALNAPLSINGAEVKPGASIGIAMAPDDARTYDRLLKSADLALYAAKSDGRGRARRFQPEMDAELQTRLTLEKKIRQAIEHNSFHLDYQPVFEVSGRNLVGFEALLRLPDGEGMIEPMVFIPVAEDMRVIDRIGAWVLREACRTASAWPEHLTVAVNLSPAQFETGSISQIVGAALLASGLAANRLELEITETLLIGDSAHVMEELRRLKDMGVAVVMDDFGTGYSSLSYLWRFPFDKIKIDRSFMTGFDDTGRDAETVIRTIIALGRQLHMRVTVEGVETANQVAFLDGADADEVQGFYFSRPIPPSEIAACILADGTRGTARPTERRTGAVA